jgi:hypothetical protein
MEPWLTWLRSFLKKTVAVNFLYCGPANAKIGWDKVAFLNEQFFQVEKKYGVFYRNWMLNSRQADFSSELPITEDLI